MVSVPNWDAVVAILIPNIVAWACVFPTIGNISNKDGTAWYQLLKKPSWAFPAFCYGPFYAYMYTCLGYASYLVYLDSAGFKDKYDLLQPVVYGAHLTLTVISCTLFYKYHKLGYTFFLMLFLDGLMLTITISFYMINKYSIIFLIPIQLWEIYGTLLNYAFWTLNSKKSDDYENLKK